MAPVRMKHEGYILNLIDTPGHSDFQYEVSRALTAAEGGILLVDAKQGIQAQTLSNLRNAKEAGLSLIGAINKVDLFEDRSKLDDLINEMAELLDQAPDEIIQVSAKTGEGVKETLQKVIKKVPPPKRGEKEYARALVFDSFYDNHKGVVTSVRVFDGELKDGDNMFFLGTESSFQIKETGYFSPEMKPMEKLENGQIGYVATGVKNPEKIRIGDTISNNKKRELLSGYKEPKSTVFVSFYPEDKNDHADLARSLDRLRLNDSSLTVEGDRNEILGRGFKVGFLGRLHYEITSERLRKEFGIETVHSFPSVKYRVKVNGEWLEVTQPEEVPLNFEKIEEPMIKIKILLLPKFLNNLVSVFRRFRMENTETYSLGKNILISALMPLSELVSDFDDVLKSVTEGYGSFSYEPAGYKEADIVRVDFLVSGEKIPGMSRFFPSDEAQREGRKMVKILKKHFPRQQYAQPVQAAIGSNIIAREDIPAFRKDVTGYLYGGDVTRKMKLREKQKKGKKKLKERSEAKLDEAIFKELLKK
jgi:GTP-binding protein LepA